MVLPSSLNVPVNRCDIDWDSVRLLHEWLIGSVVRICGVVPRS
jgi:hypothetical protein